MTRGMLRAGVVSALVVAMVGGTATVALATDGLADEIVVEQTVVEETVVEDVMPEAIEEVLPEQELPEEQFPEELPLAAPIAPDVSAPVIRMGGIEQELVYMPGTTFTIWFECEDPESGITSCVEDSGVHSGDRITMTDLGLNIWWVTAVNGAGTVSRFNLQAFVAVFWDSDIRVQLNDGDAQALNNWYKTPVAMRLTAQSHGVFPVREIRINRGYGWGATRGDTAVEDFTEEGVTTFLFYAIDEDVMPSVVGQHTMRLDFTPPTIAVTSFDDGAVFAQWSEQPLSAQCGDALSGLSSCGFDGGQSLPTDEPGAHTAIVRATDVAGNETVRVLHYAVLAGPAPIGEEPPGEEQPNEAPVPVVPAGDGLDTLAFTGVEHSRPLALLAGVLVLLGLLIAGGATWRRWERARA
jgi:hypothetical protein